MSIVRDDDAWSDHLWWQAQDRVLRRISTLIDDVRIAACRYHHGS